MEILDLFVVALLPVLKVLLITGVGLVLALDRIDLLGSNARHHLNNLVFYVFTPSLVAAYLSETITLQSLYTLWFMPVNILLTFIIGSGLAWLLIKLTKTPPHLQGLVIGCCSAGNLGNLLLIIVPAVCEEKDSPFGDSSTCSSSGETYASLSMAVGAIYIWSYVYIIMRVYADKIVKNDTDTIGTRSSHSLTSETNSDSCRTLLLSSTDTSQAKVPLWKKIVQGIVTFGGQIKLKMLFNPSTIAAIVGFTIGIIAPIRKTIVGDNAPLHVIISSVQLLGEATIPSMTLIVGANLLKGLKRSEVGVAVIVGIIGIRYIVMPILGAVIVKAAHHFGMVGSDLLYQFVLMLQYTLPPAMNVGVITQLFEMGESECSVVMLWTYAVAIFFLTLWSTFYMWLVSS